ncbi:transposase [Sneathiella sp.]|uniref:transposase n=1 Tax=Sneathiella sp. TaxID=1964365 RepID=UPI0035671535
MSGKQKKRFWSAQEKQMIVSQCGISGVSVSQVARRYDGDRPANGPLDGMVISHYAQV